VLLLTTKIVRLCMIPGRRNAGGRKGGFCGAAKCSVPEIVKSLTPFFLLAAPTAET
jgi:hypothetical protein